MRAFQNFRFWEFSLEIGIVCGNFLKVKEGSMQSKHHIITCCKYPGFVFDTYYVAFQYPSHIRREIDSQQLFTFFTDISDLPHR